MTVHGNQKSVNEVMQAVMTQENGPLAQDFSHSVAGEDDLIELFDQSCWMDVTNVRLTRARHSCHQQGFSPRKKCNLPGYSP